MTIHLHGSAWPDLPDRPLVLVPVGSTEQHGPHLPAGTDSIIAATVSQRLAALYGTGTVVAPVVHYGSSGEHQAFPGTCSIGNEVLRLVLIELVRSISRWAGRIVFVNAHGGNLTALCAAVAQMITEGHPVSWVPCAPPGADPHAGATETSLMLHIHPDLAHTDRIGPGNSRALQELLPELRAGGVRAVSPNGVLGDPTSATAEKGAHLLDHLADDIHRRILAWQPTSHGMLAAPSAAAAR